ncbi:MAG: flagellin [Acetobacterium sp.]|nr:flagellin [Acetobacterium sp.]
MRINHNIAALNTYNKLSSNQATTAKSLEKLSSGLKINKAGDNAAGLAISEKMRGQIRGLDQASTNASDAISLINTAEGALGETHSILQRMRELAVQSSNDTNVTIDRSEIQKEMNQLTSEINRIGNTTEFNTQKLLDGSKTATEATSAKAVGVNNLDPSIQFSATATSGYAQGANLSFGINLHNAYGASANGNLDISGGLTITAGANELTLTVDGEQKTIALAPADYTGADSTALLAQINTQLTAAAFTTGITATEDANGFLQLTTTATGAGHSITIDGGAGAGALFGANWATTDVTLTDSADANNVLTFEVDGAAKSITLAQGTYNNITTLTNAVQAGIVAGGHDALVEADSNGSALMLKSLSTGATSAVDTFGGSGQNVLGFASATEVSGNTASNSFSIDIDGTTKNITLEEQTYTDSTALAGMLQAKINESFGEDVVSVKVESGKLAIETTSKEGVTSGIEITGGGFTVATGLAAVGNDVDVQGTAGQNADISFQIGANTAQSMKIQISDMRSKSLQLSGDTAEGAIVSKDGTVTASLTATNDVTNVTAGGTTAEYALDVSTHDKATKAITIINDAIESVSAERSKLGSYQNRLEHTINNLGTSSENLTTAESRIRDVDMAKEMMEFTKNNILSQAAQSMLAQANQQPQGVLQLLQ